jgi:hypothetical protein
VGKLDSALLFLLSTVGIIFAVIRAVINPSASIVTAIPLVVLGIMLPFYYGYVRGALVRSSTVDRYRGWIFFLVGLGAYGYSYAVTWVNEVLPAYVGRGAYLVDIPLAVLAVLPAYLVARRFHTFFLRILGEPSSKILNRAALSTALAVVLFAAVFSNIVTIADFNLSIVLGLLALLAAGIYLFRVGGRYAGYANSDVLYSVQVVSGRWHGKKWLSMIVRTLYYGGLFLFVAATLYFLTAASTVSDLFYFLLELIIAISLIVASIPLSDLVGEREVYQDKA